MEGMRRRDFLYVLGSAAAAWPLLARAQKPSMPVIGFLCSASMAEWAPYITAFRNGLNEAGFTEGRNVAIEYRWADNHLDRLPALVDELIGQRVAAIFAGGGDPPALAAKAKTTTIPIIFAHGTDPIKDGLVASLNRPGGNVTGISFLATAIITKRLELLRELVPKAATIAVLVNPSRRDAEIAQREIREAAQSLGLTPIFLNARSEREIDAAFASLSRQKVDALFIGADRLFNAARQHLAEAAIRHAIPTIHDADGYPAVGGLMSYGPNFVDVYRQAGVYTGRILKGEKPSDLPVLQPTKFDLIINLKTAKTLNLSVPPRLLALTDKVIE
jgi:putative ABC transport system substrate-binding protein